MRSAIETWIPFANTSLIVISGVFLLLGYFFIRQKHLPLQQRLVLHKRSMLTATTFAALFLVVYVTRALLFETKIFAGEGWVRAVYLTILISHTILAILVGPFALVTLRRALTGQFAAHRRIARVTFPMWLYVVATGWIIYYMLHHLSGGDAGH